MLKEYFCSDIKQLDKISLDILSLFSGKRKFALFGELGSGKTTIIKYFCKNLYVIDTVTSPTFTIVNEYFSKKYGPVYHFDFYRIKEENEVFNIGFEEYIYSPYYCFLEWAEKVKNFLPENFVNIKIKEKNNTRKIIVYE